MSSVTDCIYHPDDDHGETDHGCYASVGDLVEILNPMGQRTGIYSLVTAVETSNRIGPMRYLQLYGQESRIKDSLVRIINRS
jgi:hypothetical protein